MISSFLRLSHQDTGFESGHLWTGAIVLPPARYPDVSARTRFVEQIQKTLQNLPGFEKVAISGDIPLTNGNNAMLYTRPDGNVLPVSQRPGAPEHDVSAGYFRTWGIPLRAGRDFDEHDLAERPNVVILSQSGARKLFGDENPIGRTLLITSGSVPVEIVGVVGDVRTLKVAVPNEIEMYRPWAQENFPNVSVAIRSHLQMDAITQSVRTQLSSLDPGLALIQPGPMDEIVAKALGQARLMMWLLGIFAGVAFLLATIGIYGAVAYTVEQRTGEIGVRMALGAQTADVLRLVVSQGMKPVLLGLLAGLAAALALGRLIAAQLYQISAHNPALLGGTAILLAFAALLACLVPARRASLLNPVQALRAD
ncbi:MAG: ABC transporter permease [Chthoniobacterales bacterium]